MEELVGFLVVFGDVCILMETKYFWVGCDGEGPDIVDIGLERKPSVNLNVGSLGFHECFRVCLDPIGKK